MTARKDWHPLQAQGATILYTEGELGSSPSWSTLAGDSDPEQDVKQSKSRRGVTSPIPLQT